MQLIVCVFTPNSSRSPSPSCSRCSYLPASARSYGPDVSRSRGLFRSHDIATKSIYLSCAVEAEPICRPRGCYHRLHTDN